MTILSCLECYGVFSATSEAEARDAYKKLIVGSYTGKVTFEDLVSAGDIAYARYCPYCGSVAIHEKEGG